LYSTNPIFVFEKTDLEKFTAITKIMTSKAKVEGPSVQQTLIDTRHHSTKLLSETCEKVNVIAISIYLSRH
jgi:hypothetical protein